MKNIFLLTAVILLVSCNSVKKIEEQAPAKPALKSAPFSKGVNFSGWFETNAAGAVLFTRYTEQDFIDVKSLGADVIRLPVKMHSMTSGDPDYKLDPLLLEFLDAAVNWAEKHEIYLIIDNHSFDPVLATSPDIHRILLPVWRQIAERYRNRSDYIVYEILNEPHGISDALWGSIQERAIAEIRKVDQKHAIIVGGTEYNSLSKLAAVPKYQYENIIYTFHFYDPYLFTHQGATWGGPPLLTNLANLPFPGDLKKMPRIPLDLRGTWIESSLQNRYLYDASYAALGKTLDKAVAFSLERDVPVFCGEFGVFMRNSKNEDRIRWYEFVSKALDERNISRTSWDYYGGFGIFNADNGSFNYDLNVDIVRALRFNPPAQAKRTLQPAQEGFIIFDDYPGKSIRTAGYWGDDSVFSMYDANAAQGKYAIRWGNMSQYNTFHFDFDSSVWDFSALVKNGYNLEFKARAEKKVEFDVRFLNRESPASIPWRMRFTVDEKVLAPDGKWHTIRIPLQDMSVHGAWISATQSWRAPEPDCYSWKDTVRLEVTSEHSDLKGVFIWFDDIKITK